MISIFNTGLTFTFRIGFEFNKGEVFKRKNSTVSHPSRNTIQQHMIYSE